MKNFIINNINLLLGLPTKGDCTPYLGKNLTDILTELYDAILIAIPVIVIALSTIDIAKAAIAQDDKDMKVAQSKALKRLIIGVVIMLIPVLLDTLLKLAGITSGNCKIGL